jgi:predicted amidophosphoribosyltransferase
MLGFSPLALGVALAAVVVVVLLLSYLWGPDRKRDWTVCPECQKAIQKGRRYCPFCKAEVIKYGR